MMNCREASRLASERMDRELAIRERIALRFHLLMCRTCSRYARQLQFLGEAVTALRSRGNASADDASLPDATRERIAARLRAEANGSASGPPSE